MIFTNLPDEVMIVSPATELDEYGNPSLVFNEDVSAIHTKGWLQREQGVGGESSGAERSTSSALYRLFLPAGTAISARDRVHIDEVIYTVDGEPTIARGLRGASHVKARVHRLEG